MAGVFYLDRCTAIKVIFKNVKIMTQQKTQTLIMLPNHGVVKRIDDFLYQPIGTIIINDTEYHKYNMYDEFDLDGWLIRKIWLK